MSFAVSQAQAPAPNLWNELEQKRSALPGFHQEFEVTRINRPATGYPKSDKWRVGIDWKGAQWREQRFQNWGTTSRISTDSELLTIDEGLGEFKRERFDLGIKPRYLSLIA